MILNLNITGWLFAGLIFLLDRYCKSWFLARPHKEIDLKLIKFSLSLNPGVSFGWFSQVSKGWILGLNLFVGLVFLVAFFRVNEPLEKFALGLILIGAVGNFIDRLIYSCVVDYIHLRWFPPVFNLSDVIITMGAVLILWQEVVGRR